MNEALTALESAIDEAPDDRGRFSVLADWYQERGDVRGELIALQLSSTRSPREAALIAAQRIDASDVKWRWGFVESLRFERSTSELATLLAKPACRFIRSLELEIGPGDEALAWLSEHAPKTLRSLSLTCNEADLTNVRGRLKQLDELRFAAQLLTPGVLPPMRVLELPIDAMTDAGLMHVLGTQPRLRALTLTSLEGIHDDAMRAVTELTKLETLELSSDLMTVGAVRVLIDSWVLRQTLVTLDVSRSGLTEEAAKLLLDAVPTFTRLSSLVVGASPE